MAAAMTNTTNTAAVIATTEAAVARSLACQALR